MSTKSRSRVFDIANVKDRSIELYHDRSLGARLPEITVVDNLLKASDCLRAVSTFLKPVNFLVDHVETARPTPLRESF